MFISVAFVVVLLLCLDWNLKIPSVYLEACLFMICEGSKYLGQFLLTLDAHLLVNV